MTAREEPDVKAAAIACWVLAWCLRRAHPSRRCVRRDGGRCSRTWAGGLSLIGPDRGGRARLRRGGAVVSDEHPAGARASDSAAPAGTTATRTGRRSARQWRRVQASYKRGNRGGQYRRRAARGTLPGPGMIRRPPPDDAA